MVKCFFSPCPFVFNNPECQKIFSFLFPYSSRRRCDSEARSAKRNVPGAIYQTPRYLENGPLEPGWYLMKRFPAFCDVISLVSYRYASPLEFVDDARTVFLNCEEFNEDDSEVRRQ